MVSPLDCPYVELKQYRSTQWPPEDTTPIFENLLIERQSHINRLVIWPIDENVSQCGY
jgi:hypothetical protein